MTSRERLLTAISLQEADRVPICFRNVAPLEHLWRNAFERVTALATLGVDDKLQVALPWAFHPDVRVRLWREQDERGEILCKGIETPAGPLRFKSRLTDDWAPADLPLVSDHHWSRGTEFMIGSEQDLDRLAYLLQPVTGDRLADFRARKDSVRRFAEGKVLVEGVIEAASNVAFSLLGPDRFLTGATLEPTMVGRLLQMLETWIEERLEVLLDSDVDTVYHTACYETTALWSPRQFRELFADGLRRKAALCHQAETRLHLYMDTGFVPLLDDFLEIGIDILSTVDPVMGGMGETTLADVKARVGHHICLWGGVNSPHTIERGTKAEVRRAVREAIEAMAPGGGFVLSTADSVWDPKPEANVQEFIAAGLEYGRYPLAVGGSAA
jgi:hypothetical protein